MVQPW